MRLWHPLTAILLIQAVLTLAVIRSNTAFGDEANYLELGRGLIGHWLHGTPWRSHYGLDNVSGSTFFYPPIGAMASELGGLFAARLLSLIFMLGATALLYSTTSRLFDSKTAGFAAALWAVHGPTIQLGAFATFDAMSISLTALSAWLVVQAGFRRHRGEIIAASGMALGAANLAAFSGVAIDPLVVIFALLVWNSFMGLRQACYCTAWFMAATLAFFAAIMTLTRTWRAIMTDVFARVIKTGAGATPLHIFQDSWTYTGLIMVLAAVGAAAALSRESRSQFPLVGALALASLVIPIAQAHDGTAVSLQKHLAYGAWFASIAAGYGCRRLTQQVNLGGAAVACAASIALIYPATNGWWSAWHWYHSWPNSTSLVAAESAVLPEVKGEVFISSLHSNAAYFMSGYYLRQNLAARKIVNGPPTLTAVNQNDIGAVVLFVPASASIAGRISNEVLESEENTAARQNLISYLDSRSDDDRQLAEIALALDENAKFRLLKVGEYKSTSADSIYAIWVRI